MSELEAPKAAPRRRSMFALEAQEATDATEYGKLLIKEREQLQKHLTERKQQIKELTKELSQQEPVDTPSPTVATKKTLEFLDNFPNFKNISTDLNELELKLEELKSNINIYQQQYIEKMKLIKQSFDEIKDHIVNEDF